MTEQKKILTLNAKWILINCNNCCVLQNFCHFWGHLSENFGEKMLPDRESNPGRLGESQES